MVILQPCLTRGNRRVKITIPSGFFLAALACISTRAYAATPTSNNEATINAGKAKGLVVHAGQGEVSIRAARQSTVKIAAHTFPGSGTPCSPSATIENKQVVVKLDGGPMGPCQGNLDIVVPQQFDIDVTIDNGTVRSSGTRGVFKLVSHQGNAVLGGRYTRLEATLDNGSMSANGLFGDSIIVLDNGNAQLWYESPKGNVQMTVKRGNVTIVAPVQAAAVHTNVMQGQAKVGVATSETAAFSVDGTIEQGNLTVRAN